MERRELKLVLIALLIGGIIVSVPVLLLGWAGYQHYHSKAIHVTKIEEPNYLNLTSKLEEYPPLREAVNEAGAEVQLSVGEYFRIRNLVGSSDYLKINGTVYRVHLTWAAEGSKVEEADNFTTVSREELENCTIVEDIIMSIIENEPDTKIYGERYPKYRAISYYKSAEELHKAKDLVRVSNVIKFEGEYYEVIVETNLSLSRYQSPRCMHVTKEQLEEYPTLQKALEQASESESGEAALKTPPEEWREIHVRDCVSYNGSQYKVGFSLA